MLDPVQPYTSHHQTPYECGTRCTRIQELRGTSGFIRHCPELVRENLHLEIAGHKCRKILKVGGAEHTVVRTAHVKIF